MLTLGLSLSSCAMWGAPQERWSPANALTTADILLDATLGVSETTGAVSIWSSLIGDAKATQGSAARQPTLMSENGVTWLEFDGLYDHLETNVVNGPVREVHMAVRVSGMNGTRNQILYGAMSNSNSTSGTSHRSFVCLTPDGYLSMSVGTMTGGNWAPYTVNLFDTDVVLGFSHDAEGHLTLYVDGVVVGTTTNTGASAPINTSRIANLGNTSWHNFNTMGRFYGLCDMPRLLNATERSHLVSWLAAKQGRAL